MRRKDEEKRMKRRKRKEGRRDKGEERIRKDERKGREEGAAHLYPSKKARALLKVGVGMPRVTAVATTFRHESCTVGQTGTPLRMAAD